MAEQIFRKETDWNTKHDFAGAGELCVTITLAEYRELVEYRATASDKINKLHARIYELESGKDGE